MVWPESKISSLFGANRKSIYGFPRAPNPDSQKVGKDEREMGKREMRGRGMKGREGRGLRRGREG